MIALTTQPIERQQVISAVECPEAGAIVTFDGTVRNHARGKTVTHLFYEAYDAMAMKEMQSIAGAALQKWSIRRLAMVHRVGRMEIGDSSIFIAVSSDHREQAFGACRFTIDSLKSRVPIWKKEYYLDGDIWIEDYQGRTSGV